MLTRDLVLKDYVMDIERYLEGKVLTWDYGTKFQQIDSTICNQDMKVNHDCKHVKGQDRYVKSDKVWTDQHDCHHEGQSDEGTESKHEFQWTSRSRKLTQRYGDQKV